MQLHRDHQWSLEYMCIFLDDFEVGNQHFVHNRMDRHISHFYTLELLNNRGHLGIHIVYNSHKGFPYVQVDMYTLLYGFLRYIRRLYHMSQKDKGFDIPC